MFPTPQDWIRVGLPVWNTGNADKKEGGVRGRVREGILRGIFCPFFPSDFEDASLYCDCCANIQSRKPFAGVRATV